MMVNISPTQTFFIQQALVHHLLFSPLGPLRLSEKYNRSPKQTSLKILSLDTQSGASILFLLEEEGWGRSHSSALAKKSILQSPNSELGKVP